MTRGTSHKESPIAGPWIGSPTLVQVSLTDCLVPGKRSNRKTPVRTAIYALAVVCLAVFQRRIVYFPDRRLTRRPAEAGMSGVEELRLLTDDGEMLVAWHLPPRDDTRSSCISTTVAAGVVNRVPRFRRFAASGYSKRRSARRACLIKARQTGDRILVKFGVPGNLSRQAKGQSLQ